MSSGLAIIGLTLLLVAAVSRRLSSTPVTPAMVVTAVGVLVGPLVLNDLSVRPTSSTVRTLAEATLAVVLVSRYANWYRTAADKRAPAMESKPMHEYRSRGLAAPPSS